MKFFAILVVVAAPVAARAQLTTENTKQACSDKIDNDGDGRVDCADQDCWDLVMCQHEAAPANPGARKSGYTKVVLGAVLLPLGFILGGVSAVPWVYAPGERGDTRTGLYGAAGAIDVLAVAGIAAGTALLAIGVGEVAGSHDRRATLMPSLRIGRESAALSLSLTF